MAKTCGHIWYTGIKKRVKHTCGQAAEHIDDHVCDGKLCTTKKENDAQFSETAVEYDDVSVSDTHILDDKNNRGFGVQMALCGAKRQELLGKSRGCNFAPAPSAATCPVCRKRGGLK